MDEEKKQEEKKDKLPELPSGEDPYWEGAEKIPLNPITLNKDCRHYFEIVSGYQAQCKKCLWGIFLGSGDRIENGHLYSFDKLII